MYVDGGGRKARSGMRHACSRLFAPAPWVRRMPRFQVCVPCASAGQRTMDGTSHALRETNGTIASTLRTAMPVEICCRKRLDAMVELSAWRSSVVCAASRALALDPATSVSSTKRRSERSASNHQLMVPCASAVLALAAPLLARLRFVASVRCTWTLCWLAGATPLVLEAASSSSSSSSSSSLCARMALGRGDDAPPRAGRLPVPRPEPSPPRAAVERPCTLLEPRDVEVDGAPLWRSWFCRNRARRVISARPYVSSVVAVCRSSSVSPT